VTRASTASPSPEVAYVDSSAIVKRVIDETESTALEAWLDAETPRVVTSRVAWIEVLRAARVAVGSDGVEPARRALAAHDILELTPLVADEAARLASDQIRSLDAVHLASALVCAADLLITYDRRLAQAARELGLRVEHPGVAPER